MEVQGYDQPRREAAQPKVSDAVQSGETSKEGSRRLDESVTAIGTAAMEENGDRMVPGENRVTYGTISRISRDHIPDFEVALKEIDNAIHNYSQTPKSNIIDPVTVGNQAVSSRNLIEIEVMEEDHTWDNQLLASKGDVLDSKCGAKTFIPDFKMGWMETGLKGESNKLRPMLNGSKGNKKLKPKSGSVLQNRKEPKKGKWTREVTQRPNCNVSPTMDIEIGVKRKAEASNRDVPEEVVQEKKKKLTGKNEDTEVAEVAGQPR